MESLKKYFPLSYKYVGSAKSVLIGALIYVIVGLVAGAAIALGGLLTGWIPLVGAVVGWALRIVGILVDVYVLAGIAFLLLAQFKVVQ